MRKLLLLAACVMAAAIASAQSASLATKIQNQGVIAGSVTVDGTPVAGYIKKIPTWTRDDYKYQPFWEQQELIRFIEKDKFDKAVKVKSDDYTEYTPKMCDGFMYGDQEFCSVKFLDGSSVASIAPRKTFLRKVGGNDKVTFYLHYNKIPQIQIQNVNALSKDDIKKIVENPNLVYQVSGSDRAKGVEFINEKKDFTDCPTIQSKIASGSYSAERTPEANRQLTGYDGSFKTDGVNMTRNLNIIEDVVNGVK